MTDDKVTLLEPVGKQLNGALVRDVLAVAAKWIVKAEMETRTGAAKGVRSPSRQVQRNDSRKPDLNTGTG